MKFPIRLIIATLLIATPLVSQAEPVSEKGVRIDAIQAANSVDIVMSFEPENLNASALSFSVELPATVSNVDTSSCLSELPKEFSGGCRYLNGMLKVIVYSPQNKPIGPVMLGTVSMITNSLSSSGGVQSRDGRRELQLAGRDHPGRRAILDEREGVFNIRDVDIGIPNQ